MLHPDELEIAKNAPPPGCSPESARQYTRWLATHHYENFNVASWLLPQDLHQHFYNLYAYCRWADDLGDEVPDAQRALHLLDWWEGELDLCYEGRPSHAVFVALRETIVAKDIPRQPFADLLRAFRQDQTVKRYPTWESVLDYCVYSANPVGRLVLYLCGYRDEHRQKLSDATCTALQLANFWQDVSRDLEKGRIYIPLDAAAHHGVSEDDILSRRFSQNYIALMKDLIARTRGLFVEGLPLARQVEGKLSVDLEMFSRGGLAVLDAIETQSCDTLNHRPAISKAKQVGLLGSVLLSRLFSPNKPVDEVSQDGTGPNRLGDSLTETVSAGRSRPSDVLETAQAPIALAGHGPSYDLAHSYEACWNLAREAHSNFYYAFFLLPKPKRDGMAALYAFMRLVDNVADDGDDIGAKQRGLAKWRAALDQAITGCRAFIDGSSALTFQTGPEGASAVLPALVDTMRRFEMPARYLHDQISGAEMDLTVHSYPTFDRLREYCYRVAGTVGLTCTHIFGFKDPRALDLAEKLGLAFQLTNIIRDVHEDAERGRVYLPDEDLVRFNVSPQDFSKSEGTLGIRELLRFEADRAFQLYQEGSELLDLVDSDSRGTLWLLIHTYNALLARIEALDFAVFSERIRISKAEKMLFIARARFGRHTRENVLEKRDRDWRRAGGASGRRRAG
ncbi:MAG TPA: squalene synthase HpnC [Candidatus Acidoferrum sp.]|nr:squalene synthase HpnC [Candidatus Acidoferrum sp.]